MFLSDELSAWTENATVPVSNIIFMHESEALRRWNMESKKKKWMKASYLE
jgi:hypothetical protein